MSTGMTKYPGYGLHYCFLILSIMIEFKTIDFWLITYFLCSYDDNDSLSMLLLSNCLSLFFLLMMHSL